MLGRPAPLSANLCVPCGELLCLPRAVQPNLGRRWPEVGKFLLNCQIAAVGCGIVGSPPVIDRGLNGANDAQADRDPEFRRTFYQIVYKCIYLFWASRMARCLSEVRPRHASGFVEATCGHYLVDAASSAVRGLMASRVRARALLSLFDSSRLSSLLATATSSSNGLGHLSLAVVIFSTPTGN